MSDDQAVLPFAGDEHLVRRQWHEGQWYFSVVDVIAVLTESADPRKLLGR